jgi:hypothetical protein
MADEIEALLRHVEAENAAMQAKLAARQHERELAEAHAIERCRTLQLRLLALLPELESTRSYVEVLKHGTSPPSPRRMRLQLVQLLIRAGLCGAAAVGGALLYLTGMSEPLVMAALAIPGVTIWLVGDRCDSLETRHG